MINHVRMSYSRLPLLALVLTALPTVACAEGASEGAPVQWRVIWHEDPATRATVSWNTSTPGTVHRVFLREDGAEETQTVNATLNGRYSGSGLELYYHHTRLTGLKPVTKYHVEIESDGIRSPAMYFVTAPDKDVPIAILYGADSRSGLKERRQMNAMIARMVKESYAPNRIPILAFAHGGDYIVNGTDLRLWSTWMTDHELTVGDDGRLLPIIPARGNHDRGQLFNEVFAFPPDDENYYALNLSSQVRLITLNTETSIAGSQVDWLAAELKHSRPVYRWLIAQYHRPAFPAVKNPALNLKYWVPLFERFNVDLVCEGDGHVIKRTGPIRDQHVDPNGVVYIGEGGLGVEQRTPKEDRWYLQPPQAKVGRGHHVQLLTFEPEKLTYRAVLLGGEVFDKCTIPARSNPVEVGAIVPNARRKSQ